MSRRDPAVSGLPDRFEILRKLGQGGMGEVYLARDRELDRRVAIKTLRSVRGRAAGERFAQEAAAMAAVEHPHLLRIFDCQVVADPRYLVTEFVAGEDLERLIRRGGPLEPGRVVRLATQLGGALARLHEAGVLHRDIKPANIMVRGDRDDAVLMDLGLSRSEHRTALTETGNLVGTPLYLPLEVLEGRGWSPAADQYQLAATIYECLAGRPLLDGVRWEEFTAAHQAGHGAAIRALGLPRPLRAALLRALRTAPASRFPSVRDFAAALRGPGRAEAGPRRPAATRDPASSTLSAVALPAATSVAAPATAPGRRSGALVAVGVGAFLVGAFSRGGVSGGGPRQLEWRVLGDRVFAALGGRTPGARLEIATAAATRSTPCDGPRCASGALPRGEVIRARIRWRGGESGWREFRPEAPVLRVEGFLADGSGVRLAARVDAAVGWAGAATREVGPGRPAVLRFPDRGVPDALVGEAGELRWRVAFRPREAVAALLERALETTRRLPPARARFEAFKGVGYAAPAAPWARAWLGMIRAAPEVFAARPEPAVRDRTLLALRALGGAAVPGPGLLGPLPPVPGAHRYLDATTPLPGSPVEVLRHRARDPDKLFSLRNRYLHPPPRTEFIYATDSGLFRWPVAPTRGGEAAWLWIGCGLHYPGAEFRLVAEPPGSARLLLGHAWPLHPQYRRSSGLPQDAATAAEFLRRAAHGEDQVEGGAGPAYAWSKREGGVGLYLPADRCPRPGTPIRVTVETPDPVRAVLGRIKAIHVEFVREPGTGRLPAGPVRANRPG